uniref:Uncharacterized protein n=1 Tax=Anopheles albimanus TaxID=7167 RepID=A0A182FZ92_ANOAL
MSTGLVVVRSGGSSSSTAFRS